jgi:hypothetical protein
MGKITVRRLNVCDWRVVGGLVGSDMTLVPNGTGAIPPTFGGLSAATC